MRERQPLFFALSLVIWRVSAILELDKAVVFRSFVFTRNRHAAHTFKPSANSHSTSRYIIIRMRRNIIYTWLRHAQALCIKLIS